jgi:hypothetical protein
VPSCLVFLRSKQHPKHFFRGVFILHRDHVQVLKDGQTSIEPDSVALIVYIINAQTSSTKMHNVTDGPFSF